MWLRRMPVKASCTIPWPLPLILSCLCVHRGRGLILLYGCRGVGRVFPYAGIQFMTFDAAKYEILQVTGKQQLSNVESLFAGSFAGPSRLPSPLSQAPGA